MDVSQESMNGTELLETFILMTGLPEDLARTEVARMLKKAGCDPESLTLDGLRQAMMLYLEEMSAAEPLSPDVAESALPLAQPLFVKN